MIIIESIKLALKAIWAHKIRSFLTMLGILIGITSVVLLVSLGEGVKEDIKGLVNDMGSNFIVVVGGDLDTGQTTDQTSGSFGGMSNPANMISGDIFSEEDIIETKKIDGVGNVSPIGMVSGFLIYDDKNSSPIIMAARPELKDIMTGFDLDKGRFITDEEYDDNRQVIMLGYAPTEQLFGDDDPIGKKILINNQKNEYEFEVVGTLSQPQTSSLFGSDLESMAIVPYSVSKELFFDGNDKMFRVALSVDENYDAQEIGIKVKESFLKRHEKEEFTVMTQEDMLAMLDDILNMLTLFITAIAAISLVVGGVGIMNIMLVSVTERTREIGLRKAVGATNGAILFQFIMEAIILSVVGGLISLLMVAVGVELVKYYSNITPVITTASVLLSMSVCIGIGLVFGIAPAIQASRKDPIESLRYE